MNLLIGLVAGLVGYLIGSVTFSRVVEKLKASERSLENLTFSYHEENQEKTRTVLTGYGGDRVSIVYGPKWGIITGLLDMFKITLPMIFTKYILFPQEEYYLIIAITGLIGHNWPIFFRFKGGRGLSLIIGSYIVIDWIGAIITLFFGFLIGLFLIGDAMIAYPLGYWLMIPWFFFRTDNRAYFLYAILSNIIFLLAAIPEIREDLQVRKEGNYKEYREALLQSTPRGRSMKAIEEKVLRLGYLRIIIGFLALMVFIFIIQIYQ